MATMQEISEREYKLMQEAQEVMKLRQQLDPEPVENYVFDTPNGEVTLSELFGEQDDLIVVHNMGKGCKYCSLWADGFSSLNNQLQSRAKFVVSSPDSPEVQASFAADRKWKFPMVSTHNSTFTKDMGFKTDRGYMPGVSAFHKDGDTIVRTGWSWFGPYDLYSSPWHLFGLLKDGVNDWQPLNNEEAAAQA